MLNNKGFSLLETLFAFQIFICIVMLLTSIVSHVYIHKTKLIRSYDEINVKEEKLSEYTDISEFINVVLH